MLQAMLDQSHAQIAYLDPQFNFMAVNAAYARGSGYAQEALIGRNHFALFPHAENEAIFTQARDTGQAVTFVAKPFVFPDRPELGTTYWDWTLVPIKGTRGAVSGLVLSLTDVTPREVARQALAESEARYRLLVDAMAEGLASLDMSGKVTFVNDEFCRMLGYAREELIGRHHLDLVHPRQHPLHQNELSKRSVGRPGTFETVLLRRDGSSVPVILAGRPLRDQEGRVYGTLAAITDISALRDTELALSRERDFVAAVLDTAQALVIVLDPQGCVTRFNRACERLTGYTFEQVRGRPFWDIFLVPEERDHVRATFDALRAGHFPNQRENYWVAKDGSQRLIAWSNTAMIGDEGAVQYIVSTGIDVTEARLAEEATRSLARFPSENPGPVCRVSRDGVLLYANGASAGLLDMWATQAGHALPDAWRSLVSEVLRGGTPRVVETKCGDVLYAVEVVPICEAGYVNLYATDITERAEAQAALWAARDQLELRVQERTRELAEANRALQVLSQSERQQRLAAEGLLQATLALNSSLDLDGVLGRILAQTQRAIPCTAVAVAPISTNSHIAWQSGFRDLYGKDDALSATLPRAVLDTALITDTQQDQSAAVSAGLDWVRSCVAAPLKVEQQTMVGTLWALSDRVDGFSPDAPRLMEGFAAHAATAIRNAELYEAAVHARGIAESLAEASVALTRTLDLQAVINSLLDHLGKLVPYQGSSLALMREKGRLVTRLVRGRPGLADVDAFLDMETSPHLRAMLETRRSTLIPDTRLDPDWAGAGIGDVMCWLGVPLIVGHEMIGLCELHRGDGDPFTPEHVQVAEALVGQAAVAIQNAWLFDQVRAGQERLQALSRRLVDAQEDERRYIARELHDEAAQGLTYMRVGLSLLEREAGHSEAARSVVNELKHTLDGILENIGRLINHLRPASLDHLGLEPALRQYVEWISQQYHITVAYEALGLGERLPLEVETAIYRIVQEALSNVVRHAQSTRVDVLLEQRNDKLIALVEDNGLGFDFNAAEGSQSLGLAGMRERAEMLGGTLVVETSAGVGTTVLVEVPYAH
jgi:PAS domain S-box-containing protein